MQNRRSTSNPPRWVTAFGVIAVFVVWLVVALHFTGNGFGGHTLHSGVVEHGGHQP